MSSPSLTSPPSSLRQRAARGALWTLVASLTSRAIGLAGTLALTRFLDLDEYGEVSLASVVVTTASVASGFGLGQFIASHPHASRRAMFHATFHFVVLGIVALGLAILLGRPLGALIHAPGMVRFLPGLAFAALLERVGTIPDRVQVRDMRFSSVSLQRSAGELVFSVLSVTLAASGAHRWWGGANAVVLASIARSGLRLLSFGATTARRAWLEPCRITWAETRALFDFGLPLSLASLAGYGARRWDNLVFSHHFGQAGAGVYNLAYNLADIPASQIGETIGDVLVPSFAHMAAPARRRAALLLSLRMILLIVAPLSVGLGAVSPTLVGAFFDARWAAVAPELTLLAALSVTRPIGWIQSSFLQVEGRSRAILGIECLTALGVALALDAASRWAHGLFGFGAPERWACASIGLMFAGNALGYMIVIKKTEGLSLASQLLPALGPLAASLPMVLAVLASRRLVSGLALPGAARLAIEIAAGALAFLPSAWALAPGACRELLGLVGQGLGRPSPAARQAAS